MIKRTKSFVEFIAFVSLKSRSDDVIQFRQGPPVNLLHLPGREVLARVQAPAAGPRGRRAPLWLVDRAAAKSVPPALVRLSSLPRAVPFVVMLTLIVAGLWVQGIVGFALILAGVLFLGWLLYLGWPALRPPERLMRMSVIVLGSGLAVVQLFPK